MDLTAHVLAVMNDSSKALTVDEVTEQVAARLREEIKAILNEQVKKRRLNSVHGGGSYPTHYSGPLVSFTRRA